MKGPECGTDEGSSPRSLTVPELVIPDIDEGTLSRLQERARARGRTPQAEARAILTEATRPSSTQVWEQVQAIQEQMAASGRSFSDSADLLREDRDR